MENESVSESMDFPVEGNLYTVRKLKSGRFDIIDKTTGKTVNELLNSRCMKALVRCYLGLFGIEVGTQDGIKTGQRLHQLMDFLKENKFVTYQRYEHIEIHRNDCIEIAKHGGTGKGVKYHYFKTFEEAKKYSDTCNKDKGLEIKFCPSCLEKRI